MTSPWIMTKWQWHELFEELGFTQLGTTETYHMIFEFGKTGRWVNMENAHLVDLDLMFFFHFDDKIRAEKQAWPYSVQNLVTGNDGVMHVSHTPTEIAKIAQEEVLIAIRAMANPANAPKLAGIDWAVTIMEKLLI
jgi:hypothetical protein